MREIIRRRGGGPGGRGRGVSCTVVLSMHLPSVLNVNLHINLFKVQYSHTSQTHAQTAFPISHVPARTSRARARSRRWPLTHTPHRVPPMSEPRRWRYFPRCSRRGLLRSQSHSDLTHETLSHSDTVTHARDASSPHLHRPLRRSTHQCHMPARARRLNTVAHRRAARRLITHTSRTPQP